MAIIPKIYNKDKDINDRSKIIEIDIKKELMEPVMYYPDVDFEDDKSIRSYAKSIKTIIRGSREYRRLIQFLKSKCEMNGCFYFPKLRQYRDSKISIEFHHTGMVMEDIIRIVLNKRFVCDEGINQMDIANEVMYLHYKGMIGLTALSSTMHELIHEPNSGLFIPQSMVDFGDMNLFYEEYKPYMQKDDVKRYEQYLLVSEAVNHIEDILPNYLNVSYIYYNKEGVDIPDMNKILEIIELDK